MITAVSEDVRWLRGTPRCRIKGPTVCVTLHLDPDLLTGPVFLAWSAGGMHATTPMIEGAAVTCCLPRGIFEQHALMRLQLIGTVESDRPVFAWTQIPVLQEALFRADVVFGRPVLSPLESPVIRTSSRSAVSVLD